MKIISLFFLLFTACALTPKNRERYIVVKQLWDKKTTRDQVIENLGSSYEQVDDGIIYRFSGRQMFESGHFFDSSGKLTEQFLFISKKNFEKFKKVISCPWNEKSEMKNIGHTIYKIESGRCVSKNISYEYRPSMLLYEFRWKL